MKDKLEGKRIELMSTNDHFTNLRPGNMRASFKRIIAAKLDQFIGQDISVERIVVSGILRLESYRLKSLSRRRVLRFYAFGEF